MENLLTVVIPDKNEEAYIGQTLLSLLKQTCINREIPIYIADAGSTDNTLKVIDLYKGILNVQVVKGGIPSVGRNNGARFATTKYILFIDADIELGEKDTLEKCINLAEKKNLDLVTTLIKIKNGNLMDDVFWKIHGWVSNSKVFGAFGAGMFILIRNDRFHEIGGFNETIALGEDWELTHNIPRSKYSVCDTFILTTNRRFKFQGYLKTIWEYIMVASSSRYRHGGHFNYFDIKFK